MYSGGKEFVWIHSGRLFRFDSVDYLISALLLLPLLCSLATARWAAVKQSN